MRHKTLYGMEVRTVPDTPRYQLPPEVMPGVPWPPGFRFEFNQWARRTLGYTNVLDGKIMVLPKDAVIYLTPGEEVTLHHKFRGYQDAFQILFGDDGR